MKIFLPRLGVVLFAALLLGACSSADREAALCAPQSTPVKITGGAFNLGSERFYREEGPKTPVTVGDFWIDPHEVTNRQFARFVEETGYVTVAEKPVESSQFGVPESEIPPHLLKPGSAVFVKPTNNSPRFADWWQYIPGASWKKPFGPDGRDANSHDPVVHLAYDDMLAYARWAGGRLPTEIEWEYAAKAGSSEALAQPDPKAANTWQGFFPLANDQSDGYEGLAPAGCYPANDYGLYDMVGNVWEVTSDIYRPGHDQERAPSSTPAEGRIADSFRVMKGGSYLCAENYCQRYRPESRQPRDPAMGSSNVGFRLVYDRID